MLIISLLNYCSPEATIHCIRALAEICPREFRIVVGDHSPESQIDQIVLGIPKSLKAQLNFIHRPDNPGFGVGHDRNFSYCRPGNDDFFLVVNNDISVIDADLINVMLEACQPGVLVGPVIVTSSSQKVWFAGGQINLFTGNVSGIKSPPQRELTEVDFLCGCCMLLRAEDFIHLGGFDENFFMYAEDVDLSLRAYSLSYRCVVVNRRLAHDIGGYSGGQYSSLYLYESSKNGMVLLARHKLGWPIARYLHFVGKYLFARIAQLIFISGDPFDQCSAVFRGMLKGWNSRHIRVSHADLENDNDRSQGESTKRVLAILPHPPNHLRPRSISMLGDFCSFARVDLIYLDHGDKARIPADIRRVTRIRNSRFRRFLRVSAGCLLGKPIMYQYYHSLKLKKILKERDLSIYDAIYIKKLPLHELGINHTNIILDIPDCATKQVEIYSKSRNHLRRWLARLDELFLRRYEQKVCAPASRMLCTVEREAAAFRELGVITPVMPLAHNTNAREFREIAVIDKAPRLLSFHGKLSYFANRLALTAIHETILPHLEHDNYIVHIAGRTTPELNKQYPRLRFMGEVSNLTEYLRGMDLSIFPLEVAAGISNKALESLAAGVPIVATPELVEGLPAGDSLLERGIYARAVPDFPEAIRAYFALPLSTRQSISDSCVRYVERLHEPTKRRATLQSYVFGALPLGRRELESKSPLAGFQRPDDIPAKVCRS
jgi:GT2 family glycosyltransferase